MARRLAVFDNRTLSLLEEPGGVAKELTIQPIRRPIWTQNKARLIERYLFYFVQITKHGTYIDGFAGPQEPDRPEMWAAKLVVETRPRWLRDIHLCEMDAEKLKMLEALRDTQSPRLKGEPKRNIRIHRGDFNQSINEILEIGTVKPKTAAFCLLDQRTFECHWRTVQMLAKHKDEGHKIELFYFFGVGWLHRALGGRKKNTEVIEQWWGKSDWPKLKDLPTYSLNTLMTQRFQQELGYRHVMGWPIYEGSHGGRVMYYMIHATDHAEAPKLMATAYRKALDRPEPIEHLQLSLLTEGVDIEAIRKD